MRQTCRECKDSPDLPCVHCENAALRSSVPDWVNLDVSFGAFMYPRMMQLIKNGNGYHGKSARAWYAKLKKMAKAFKWLANGNRCSIDKTPKYVREGMTLFADNVEHLWD